ncbi:MAG: hypothetical protein ACKO9Q_02260, partial [Pirellula sp.]
RGDNGEDPAQIPPSLDEISPEMESNGYQSFAFYQGLSAEEMRPDPSQMPMFAGPNGPGRPGEGGAPGAPGQGASPEMMKRMFENRDQDKDGKLSGDEIPPQMRERLSNMDTNGDGAIDKTEMEQAMKRLEGMRPGNRRPEGRPEGRGEGGEGVRPRRPSSDT